MSLIGQIRLYRQLNRHMYNMSPAQIQQYQWQQIQSKLALVQTKSPFYQQHFSITSVHSLSDFHRLPTINKTIMMEQFDTINTVGLKKEDVMTYAVDKEINRDYLGYYKNQFVIGLSSGTSGNKGLYITPKSLTQQIPALFLARSGVFLSDLPVRILFLLRVFSQGFQDINAPFLTLRYLHSMTPPEDIIRVMGEQRTTVWMAPPSLLRMMLPFAHRVPQVKKIITYAEVLTQEDRHRFETSFHAPVTEIYQASEGQIGSPCRHGRLHINEDLVYVELYDEFGHWIDSPGKIATHMIITNLVNDAQPLLRYEMNDVIVLGEPCTCGSHFRVIDRILGRQDDVLLLPNSKGAIIHVFPDLVSRWIMTSSDAIREYRVFHHKKTTHLTIEVDCLLGSDIEDVRYQLMQRLEKEFKMYDINVTLSLRFTSIALGEGNLKFKRFIVTD